MRCDSLEFCHFQRINKKIHLEEKLILKHKVRDIFRLLEIGTNIVVLYTARQLLIARPGQLLILEFIE